MSGPAIALVSLLAVAPAERVRITLDAAFTPATLDFQAARPFALYGEPAGIDSSTAVKSGAGLEAGLEVRAYGPLWVMASASQTTRDASGELALRLPSPLFFGQDRQLSSSVAGLDHRERALHLDVVLRGRVGPLQIAGFSGLSFVQVRTSLVDDVPFSQRYPFAAADVMLGSPRLVTVEDTPRGVNAGVAVDLGLVGHLALGGRVRYTWVSASLPEPFQGSFDAIGLQVSAGLRLGF